MLLARQHTVLEANVSVGSERELAARHASGAQDPVEVDGELIKIHTSAEIDGATLVERARTLSA